MVAREVKTNTVDTERLVELFVLAEQLESTEDNKSSLADFAGELGEDDTITYANLNALEEAELMDSEGRYKGSVWWIAIPDVSAENAESIAREALANFTPEPAKPARKAVAKKTAAPAKPAAPKAPESLPEPPKEETATGLTRAEIKAELPSVKLETPDVPTPSVPKGEPFNFGKIIEALNEALKTASNDPTNYVTPEEVTSLPARPEGVNENTWDMMFNAHSVNEYSTLRARLFWTERAQSQAA